MIPAVCGNQDPGIITSATVNILSDVILIAFVTPRIRKVAFRNFEKLILTIFSPSEHNETAKDQPTLNRLSRFACYRGSRHESNLHT
jgi:hypothetical protein